MFHCFCCLTYIYIHKPFVVVVVVAAAIVAIRSFRVWRLTPPLLGIFCFSLGGGFRYLFGMFTPNLGELIQFD